MKHPNLIVRSYTKTNSFGVEISVVLTQEGVARKLDVSKFSSVDEIKDWERAAFFAYGEEEASDDGIFTIGDMFGSEFEAKLDARKLEFLKMPKMEMNSGPQPAALPIESLQDFREAEDSAERKQTFMKLRNMYSKMELNSAFGSISMDANGKFNVLKNRDSDTVEKLLKSLREIILC